MNLWNFPSPFGMIWSLVSHEEHTPPPHKFAQKRFYPMKYFLKNVPRPYFSGGDINEY